MTVSRLLSLTHSLSPSFFCLIDSFHFHELQPSQFNRLRRNHVRWMKSSPHHTPASPPLFCKRGTHISHPATALSACPRSSRAFFSQGSYPIILSSHSQITSASPPNSFSHKPVWPAEPMTAPPASVPQEHAGPRGPMAALLDRPQQGRVLRPPRGPVHWLGLSRDRHGKSLQIGRSVIKRCDLFGSHVIPNEFPSPKVLHLCSSARVFLASLFSNCL